MVDWRQGVRGGIGGGLSDPDSTLDGGGGGSLLALSCFLLSLSPLGGTSTPGLWDGIDSGKELLLKLPWSNEWRDFGRTLCSDLVPFSGLFSNQTKKFDSDAGCFWVFGFLLPKLIGLPVQAVFAELVSRLSSWIVSFANSESEFLSGILRCSNLVLWLERCAWRVDCFACRMFLPESAVLPPSFDTSFSYA